MGPLVGPPGRGDITQFVWNFSAGWVERDSQLGAAGYDVSSDVR
jgi:hypothetical protein